MHAYEYALSLTSQFYYCGLPLRLDAYSHCGFGCKYCFAAARGGLRNKSHSFADADSLARRLDRVARGDLRGVVDELLQRRQPIHFGGMTDPFGPQEARLGVTYNLLRVLAANRYPTIISTKSTLFSEPRYLDLIRAGDFAIQLSMSSLDDELMKRIDVGTPGPSALLAATRYVTSAGVRVGIRIQPVLPTRESDASAVIRAAADAGAKHVAVEHLKLAIERSPRFAKLSAILGVDLRSFFGHGASRVGREWIMPPEVRIGQMLGFRRQAHQAGLAFGSADNDLLLLSDGNCCCSAADVLGFTGFLEATYTGAARRALTSGRLTWEELASVWAPTGTISRYVNSRSRLPRQDSRPATIKDYLGANWNGRPNGNSPAMLFGVTPTDECDRNGLRVYAVDSKMVIES